VVLKNYGAEDVAIVDLPDAGSFRLVPNNRWQENRYHWVGERQPEPSFAGANVIVLRAGETHTTRIDLTDPRWFVLNSADLANEPHPMALNEIRETWSASFRVEYVPPPPSGAAGLLHADLIRHARLKSRAFTPNAGVD
jgi:hypothetical protein